MSLVPGLLPSVPNCMHSDVNEEGQRKEGEDIPLPHHGRNKVNSGIILRTDAGVLIAVDRSSKHWLCTAESGGVSHWVKGHSFTQATLVDNPGSALKAQLCNLSC